MNATLAQKFAGPILAVGAGAGWMVAGVTGLMVVMLTVGIVSATCLVAVSLYCWLAPKRIASRAQHVTAEPEDDWVAAMFDRKTIAA